MGQGHTVLENAFEKCPALAANQKHLRIHPTARCTAILKGG